METINSIHEAVNSGGNAAFIFLVIVGSIIFFILAKLVIPSEEQLIDNDVEALLKVWKNDYPKSRVLWARRTFLEAPLAISAYMERTGVGTIYTKSGRTVWFDKNRMLHIDNEVRYIGTHPSVGGIL